MKIEHEKTVVETDINAEQVTMGIDLEGMNHVMSILSNLYSDPRRAVIREYSTNARDSHLAVGITDPIEVISPNSLSSQLTIVDHGLGMSKEDILNTYSRYGSSTKRNDNTAVGAFGIGAKSAFTIASQFTVTGVKDGVKTVVLFSLKEDHTPILQILSEIETDEGNGVKVGIPITDVDTMNETIAEFFYTWKPGTVLLDGEEPKSLWTDKENVLTLSDRAWMRRADKTVNSWDRKTTFNVVMGSVAYPSDMKEVSIKAHRGATLYFEVAIGEVDIAPSREALKETEKTTNKVTDAVTEFAADLLKKEQAHIARPLTPYKKAKAMRQWGSQKGLEQHRSWENHWTAWGLAEITKDVAAGAGISVASNNSLFPNNVTNFLAITGCDTARKKGLVANRYDRWRRSTRENFDKTIVAVEAKSGSYEWFSWGHGDDIPTVDYAVFKAEAAILYKKTSSYAPTGSAEVSYRFKIGTDDPEWGSVPEIQEAGKGLTYTILSEHASWLELDDTYVQVKLAGRQEEGVCKTRITSKGGKFVESHILHKMVVDKKLASLDDFTKEAMVLHRAMGGNLTSILTALLPERGKINDQKLRSVMARMHHYNSIPAHIQVLLVSEEKLNEEATEDVKYIMKTWPLIEHMRMAYGVKFTPIIINDLVRYFNA